MKFSSMIVAAAADILVLDWQLVGHGFGAVGPVEAIAQDRVHRAVGLGADVHNRAGKPPQAARGRSRGPGAGIPKTRPEALLGMRLGGQDPLHQGDGGRADRRGLAQQPGRRPLSVAGGARSACAAGIVVLPVLAADRAHGRPTRLLL